jgi:hypothetical protein
VVDVSTSKTGKHGHAKCVFVALDIFTNKKMEELTPSSHNCEVPFVTRTDYTLLDISDDGYVSRLNVCCATCLTAFIFSMHLFAETMRQAKLKLQLHSSASSAAKNPQPHTDSLAPPLVLPFLPILQVSLMNESGDTKDDLTLPRGTEELDKLAITIKQEFEAGKELQVSVLAVSVPEGVGWGGWGGGQGANCLVVCSSLLRLSLCVVTARLGGCLHASAHTGGRDEQT